MKRLKRKANIVNDATKLLQRISEASDNLRDVYYVLFDNLNALFESYPDVYKTIERTVKLPSNNDANNIVEFNKNLKEILRLFNDPEYLKTHIIKE